MDNNFNNEDYTYRHKHSYLTIIAIVLSVISMLFSSFTLVGRPMPNRECRMNQMSEMPCQMENNLSRNKQNFKFNRPSKNFQNGTKDGRSFKQNEEREPSRNDFS